MANDIDIERCEGGERVVVHVDGVPVGISNPDELRSNAELISQLGNPKNIVTDAHTGKPATLPLPVKTAIKAMQALACEKK